MKRAKTIRGSQWALVTGGSSGIGLAIASQLAITGYNLILVAQEEEGLAIARNTIGEQHPDLKIETIAMDLAKVDSSEQLFTKTKAIANIDVLINNAGMFSFLDITKTPTERIEKIILLHDMTIAMNCRLYVTDMIERGVRGHVLNISSFSLWMPFPGLGLYSASKAFVRNFSISFAKEVSQHGIGVTTVCPAGVATDLYGLPSKLQRLGVKIGALITPESCAKRSLRAMWRHRRCIVPDWWNRLFIPFCLILPDFIVAAIRRKTMKIQV